MKHLLGLQLWHVFKYAELSQVLRHNYKLSLNLFTKVRPGNVDEGDVEKLFKARFIHGTDKHSPKDKLQTYAENEIAM